jgi:hypothetical protein
MKNAEDAASALSSPAAAEVSSEATVNTTISV